MYVFPRGNWLDPVKQVLRKCRWYLPIGSRVSCVARNWRETAKVLAIPRVNAIVAFVFYFLLSRPFWIGLVIGFLLYRKPNSRSTSNGSTFIFQYFAIQGFKDRTYEYLKLCSIPILRCTACGFLKEYIMSVLVELNASFRRKWEIREGLLKFIFLGGSFTILHAMVVLWNPLPDILKTLCRRNVALTIAISNYGW